jgi:L-ascorbate metabolism protein UlaG (beta-lactamase superfamily)
MRAMLGAAAVGAVAVGVAAAWAARGVRTSMGDRHPGTADPRVTGSPRYRDGVFHNAVPATILPPGTGPKILRELLFGKQKRRPTGVVPVIGRRPDDPDPDGLYVTWYGHSTALVDIDGHRVLFDPIWSERCSPSRLVGPRRLHPAPAPLADLLPIDAVVVSHDHYDHLDMSTILTLARLGSMPFVVPLGVGAHLRRWGVPPDRVVELDWEESLQVAGLTLTATAARHFSGRAFTRNNTLWASWALAGRTHRVFHTGDSGYFTGYAAIGAAHGPFDVTLMQIGAYGIAWPDIHMTPEQGVAAHLDLGGAVLIPLHWATFNLAMHDWAEPADRVWREAKARDVRLVVPRPGERVNIDDPPPVDGWWQTIA